MHLVDLDPHWVTLQNWSIPDKFYVGVRFLCPHCSADLADYGANRRQRLVVSFWPPIDPSGLLGKMFNIPRPPDAWERTGDTFETLTLTPSVDVSQHKHWHGHITNGEIT